MNVYSQRFRDAMMDTRPRRDLRDDQRDSSPRQILSPLGKFLDDLTEIRSIL